MFYPLSFLFVFLLFSHGTPSLGQSFRKIPLPAPAIGPEALAFDPTGAGPYVGVSDGRVLKWDGPTTGFVDFAVASPVRTKEECDGSSDPAKEPTCGRPLGLAFHLQTGELYFADPYYGLSVVGAYGGNATILATEADGVPFKLLNAVDIDQKTGIVYFTDASSNFQRRDFGKAIQAKDRSGRLLTYDPKTKKVTVLLKNLGIAGGVAVSKDGSFVLVSEFLGSRILKYWLTGQKAKTSEVFVVLPGSPDNIKRTIEGEFWLVANVAAENGTTQASGVRVNGEGDVLQTVHFNPADIPLRISEIHEFRGELFVGSVVLPFVAVFTSA